MIDIYADYANFSAVKLMVNRLHIFNNIHEIWQGLCDDNFSIKSLRFNNIYKIFSVNLMKF